MLLAEKIKLGKNIITVNGGKTTNFWSEQHVEEFGQDPEREIPTTAASVGLYDRWRRPNTHRFKKLAVL